MSMIKYRVKEVAADFGLAPKEVSDIIGKYYEKPKSNTQVLTEEELNVVFDYLTLTNQISSLEAVFAVQPKPQPKVEEKPAEPKPFVSRSSCGMSRRKLDIWLAFVWPKSLRVCAQHRYSFLRARVMAT